MGCGTCATTGDQGSPAGCKNNGTCGTSGCNKLNVYNWLADMELPSGQQPFSIVEVRFKGSRKEYYRNTNNIPLKEGDVVAVEGNPGHDIGVVSLKGELVRMQMKRKRVDETSPDVKTLYRTAKEGDLAKWKEVKEKEHDTMHVARKTALELGLSMKLSDVEYQGDGKKATFFYTADDRVDFRELIKRLADKFKVRIEMRQIGMRQEASRLGGIGSCGRELCCSTWLTDFKAVTTAAARYQNLSLNPLKLAGQCGKLKCCLNYELDSYIDAIKDFPDTNVALHTEQGLARHIKTDIFRGIMWYAQEIKLGGDGEGSSFTTLGKWIPISVERVKELIAINKAGKKISDLVEEADFEEEEYTPDYENVVGQDSITRMDKLKKKKKKKKKSEFADRNKEAKPDARPSTAAETKLPHNKTKEGGELKLPTTLKGPERPPQATTPQRNQQQGNRNRPPQQQERKQPPAAAKQGNQGPKPPAPQPNQAKPAQPPRNEPRATQPPKPQAQAPQQNKPAGNPPANQTPPSNRQRIIPPDADKK